MAEITADTSSYPKAPPIPVSPLDIARKYGDIQQQSLQINQARLDQANQGFTYLTRAMGSLGPDATKDQYKEVGANAVKLGLVPENMLHIWNERVDAAPDSPTFFRQTIAAVQDHQQQLQGYIGTPGTVANGQTVTPVRTPGFTGAQIPTGLPVQQQTPPGTVVNNPDTNTPTTVGAQAPQLAPGTVAQPTPLPVTRPAGAGVAPQSLSALTTGPTGPTVRTDAGAPATFAQRADAANPPKPAGYSAGTPPLFDEGKKAYSEDQLLASQKMTAIKPAILGLNLIQGMKTGPGTEAWNKGVAFLKANGLIKTEEENDPTAIYQEANKYFSQYLKGRGGRSDADLAAAEKSSPNVGIQLNPALQKLAKSAVAQDMIEAARPTAFAGRTDYQNYGAHRAMFPQSMDQRAFEAAISSPEERQKLVDQMHNKYKKNPNDPEALKFFKSLDVAKKAGMTDLNQ